MARQESKEVPRIEFLRVKNYRALKDLELKQITALTVLLGPNGSGKSTVFDVFAFLSECFTSGLRRAWDKRGRFKELRTRNCEGPITIEIKYREQPRASLITFHLEIEEEAGSGPVVSREWLQWKRGSYGAPFHFVDFSKGHGEAIPGETPDREAERVSEQLSSAEMLAVNTLGQFARHPRVSALRKFITGWHLSYLSADSTRGTPDAGPQERLSQYGDNLPNVIQYLREQHPDELEKILDTLRRRVPRLERVDADIMADGRLLLQIKDAPFDRPILSRFASDGTLKLLAYLTLLYDPNPPSLIGIEEPENYLHPRLLPELAEECNTAVAKTQLMVTTHSPFFVNALQPDQVWVLSRGPDGFTKAFRAYEMDQIKELVEQGARLGDLWMEGYFSVGDPLKVS